MSTFVVCAQSLPTVTNFLPATGLCAPGMNGTNTALPFEEARERHRVPLVTDCPTVLGFVENLPFRDNALDFVIAPHVLEHSRCARARSS